MSVKLKSSAGTKTVPLTSELWQITQNQLADTDLDTLTTPGMYYVPSSTGVTNRPNSNNDYGALIVLKVHSDRFAQIFFSGASALKIYTRIVATDSADDWTQLNILY